MLFDELEKELKKYNSNFHLDSLEWRTRNVFCVLCRILDDKLVALNKKIENKTETLYK